MNIDPKETPRLAQLSDGRLALRPREAAKALGIGTRLLWSLTSQGRIPHVRLGKRVVYPVGVLEEYVRQQSKGGER